MKKETIATTITLVSTLVAETKALLEEFYLHHISALDFMWKAVAINLDVKEKGWRGQNTVQRRRDRFTEVVDDILDKIEKSIVGTTEGRISSKTFANYKTQVKYSLIFGCYLDDAKHSATKSLFIEAEVFRQRKVEDGDATYLAFKGESSKVHADQMSLALAEVSVARAQRAKEDRERKERENNARLRPEKPSATALIGSSLSPVDIIPKRANYKTLGEWLYAILEMNLKCSDDNHEELAASTERLAVDFNQLVGQMAQLHRRHRPPEEVRKAI